MSHTSSHTETEKKVGGVTALSEKDFFVLYNLGKSIRVKKGEVLFREGDPNQTLFLVLKGALEATRAGEKEDERANTSLFRENDWIGEMLFFPKPQKISTVRAVEHSTVLALDHSAFADLDPRIQIFALKRLNDLSAIHMDQLAGSRVKIARANQYYRTYVHELIHGMDKQYEKSDMLFAIIKSIPHLPVYTTKLVHLLLSENASVKEVTDLAKEDPSLVSEILKTINSSYYSLKRKVSDLQYAIMYMGFYQVYQIVMSNGMRKVMPNTPEFMGIHHHSVIISHLVFEICQLCDKRSASILSTIALLHDIGKSVILLIKAKNPKLAFFVDMLDAPKVGAMLLKEWNIPESVCETVRCQYYPSYKPPSELPSEHMKNISFLYLAHACHDYMQGESDRILKHPFIDDYVALLNVSGCPIEEFIEKYVLSNLKLKMHTFPAHVRNFLSKKIDLNLPR